MTAPGAKWKVFAASVAGTSHLSRSLDCQDTHQVRIFEDGAVAAALADGAGSAKYASEGSSLATQAAVDYLEQQRMSREWDTEDGCRALLAGCLACARSRLEERAEEMIASRGDGISDQPAEASLDDFATTLLVVLLSESFVAALQVGDGAIVCRRGANALELMIEPERGEYLNETAFITSGDLEKHARYAIADSAGLDALAVFSDGIQMLALDYPDNTPHGPFFNPLFDFARRDEAGIEDLRDFLKSAPVCERTEDDKTLVLVVLT